MITLEGGFTMISFMKSTILQYYCSYHLVMYSAWKKRQEERNLKVPEICYNGCVYQREGSDPGFKTVLS